VFADLNGDRIREAIVIQSFATQVFREEKGGWRSVGNFAVPRNCTPMMDALRRGDFRVVTPQHRWNDLEVGGARVPMTESFRAERSEPTCGKP
jgi:hypothetical protein